MQNPSHRLVRSIEIDAGVEAVFAAWTDYEKLPGRMVDVRRVKQIGPTRLLWDADVMGRQLVWEARIVHSLSARSVRWRTTWGASHVGEVQVEPLEDGRTRLRVELAFEPRGLLERLGTRLGVLDSHVQRNLEGFRRSVEAEEGAEPDESPRRVATPRRGRDG